MSKKNNLSYRDLQKSLKPLKKTLKKDIKLNAKKDVLQNLYNNYVLKENESAGNKIKKFMKTKTKKTRYIVKVEYEVSIYNKEKDKTHYEQRYTVEYIKSYNFNKEKIFNKLENRILEFYPFEESDKIFDYNGKLKFSPFIKENFNKILSKLKIPLKSSSVYQPNFLKFGNKISDFSYNNLNDECVYETILNYYSKDIKKLTKSKLFDLFSEFVKNDYSDIEEYENFNIKSGVSCEMIKYFCETYDISLYIYDMNNKVVLSNKARNRNKKALVCYVYSGHIYLIEDDKTRRFLIKSYVEKNKIQTDINKEKEEKEKEFIILGYDLEIEKVLEEQEEGVILYHTTNLRCLLEQLISEYKIIPYNVIYKNYSCVQTIEIVKGLKLEIIKSLEVEHQNNIILNNLCDENNIEYKNQSFGAFVLELCNNFYNKRANLTDKEKQIIKNKSYNKCNICKKYNKYYEYDHIKPFCESQNNKISNFQILCKKCHLEKTKNETYLSYDKQLSRYNNYTKNIMNTDLFKKWSFIDRVKDTNKNKYYCDVNKCRRNILLYSEYDLPIYSCLDDIKEYKNEKIETGFYYVESSNYFPLRGNGWYSKPMINYCLSCAIITKENIKYSFKSSLKLEAGYFKPFYESLKNSINEKAGKLIPKELELKAKLLKLIFNSLIGCWGKRDINIYNSLFSSNKHEAGGLMKTKDTFIFDIGDVYEIINKIEVNKDGDYLPFYNQILDCEAIELHKMKEILINKGCDILEYNTDGILFSSDSDLSDYLDEYEFIPGVKKYKLEEPKHLKAVSKSGYIRKEKFELKKIEYNTLENLEENKSCVLLGRAGTGKSYLIKEFLKKVDKNKVAVLATTNKAAILIDGKTLHSFSNCKINHTIKNKLKNIEYIIIDEVSMMREIYYSLLLYIKNTTKINIILVGDYEQLEPVNDRIKSNTDFYKNSRALFEICENKIELTECKRSDDELFKDCLDVNNIDINSYGNKKCVLNLAFTNRKVNEINKYYNSIASGININGWNIYKGLRLYSKVTCRKLEIVKNGDYVVLGINDDVVWFTDGTSIKREDLKTYFDLGYACTIHKSQGSTYTDEYSIHEWNKLNKKLKYVALSRGIKKSLIHIIS